jgi:Mg2+ and Co2+ transporter CorA
MKLVHTRADNQDHDSDSEQNLLPENFLPSSKRSKWSNLFGLRNRRPGTPLPPYAEGVVKEDSNQEDGKANASHIPRQELSDLPPRVRTLQKYHGGANEDRTAFMEENSPLRRHELAVAVEQVSIFLTADNTIVSIFEESAEDIEKPIMSRLSSPETVLRRSGEASMIVQAVIDAIVDLAIPIATAYRSAIDELELNVITGDLYLSS